MRPNVRVFEFTSLHEVPPSSRPVVSSRVCGYEIYGENAKVGVTWDF